MKAIPEHKIQQMRQLKCDGLSIKSIARELECSPSTVSLYCRDLFTHQNREYQTETQARARIHERAIGRKRRRTLIVCADCGQPIRKGRTRCANCHAVLIRRHAAAQRASKPIEERQPRPKGYVTGFPTLNRAQRARLAEKPTVEETDDVPPCPSGVHHWILDALNQGICQNCGTKRKFMAWGARDG